ncbi:MAG: AEC family transporter [Ignavibacteria bacterium]|nr:AEC family transporter [Ignavibacteria bacterium]
MTPLLFTLGPSSVLNTERVARSHNGRRRSAAGIANATNPCRCCRAGGEHLHIPIAPSYSMHANCRQGGCAADVVQHRPGIEVPADEMLPVLLPVVVIRLVATPLAVYWLAVRITPDDDVLLATMLEASMPTMMLTMVFADRYGLDESALAQAILVTTIISMITLPTVAQWPF